MLRHDVPRLTRLIFVVLPILFGALAAWKVMADSPAWAATMVLLATAKPPALRASGIDRAIADYQTLSGEMTNLRDRFRHVVTIESHKSFAEFNTATKPLFDRLEKARARSLTPPEWAFRCARKKPRPVITFTTTVNKVDNHERIRAHTRRRIGAKNSRELPKCDHGRRR